MKKHVSAPASLKSALKSIMPAELPDGVAQFNTSTRISQHLVIPLSEYLTVQANLQIEGFSSCDQYGSKMDSNPEVRSASIHPRLIVLECEDGTRRTGEGENLYEHLSVELYLAEWLVQRGEPCDLIDLTRTLAFGGACDQRQFPGVIEYEGQSSSHHLRMAQDRAQEALTWLLDRVADRRAPIDLAQARIAAGGDVFDGNGKMLACPMRLHPNEARSFVADHGEAAFRAAMADGVLHSNSSAYLSGARFTEERIDRISERLFGGDDKLRNIWLNVSWDEAAFEEHIRPHLRNEPFASAPGQIEDQSRAMAFLCARMGVDVQPGISAQ